MADMEVTSAARGDTGKVRVSVSDGKTGTAASARTALPTLPSGFENIMLSFIPVTEGLTIPDPVEMSGATQEVNLTEGEWKIRAGGLVDGTELAYGESGAFTVSPGAAPVSVSIAMTIPTDGDPGIWNYEVSYPDSDIQAISMTVKTYSPVETASEVNLKTNAKVSGAEPSSTGLSTADSKTIASGDLSLAPGYYVLEITATRSGRDISRLDVLHVYSAVDGTKTESAYEITGDDFLEPPAPTTGNAKVTVTYDKAGVYLAGGNPLTFDEITLSFESIPAGQTAPADMTVADGAPATVALPAGAWTIKAVGTIGGTGLAEGECEVDINPGADADTEVVMGPVADGVFGKWDLFVSEDIVNAGGTLTVSEPMGVAVMRISLVTGKVSSIESGWVTGHNRGDELNFDAGGNLRASSH
jgi:hypothetical protein